MNTDLASIQRAFRERRYRFTEHAIVRMDERDIMPSEVEQAMGRGQIIADYPDDKYGPSCLLFGRTDTGRPIVQVGTAWDFVKVITVYEPDPSEWDGFVKRRE